VKERSIKSPGTWRETMLKVLLALSFIVSSFNAYSAGCYTYYLKNSQSYSNAVTSVNILANDEIIADNIKAINSIYFCAGIKVTGTDEGCKKDASDEDAITYLYMTKSNEFKTAFAGRYYTGGYNYEEEISLVFQDTPQELKTKGQVTNIGVDISAKKCLKYEYQGDVGDGKYVCTKYATDAVLKSTISILPCSSLENSDDFTQKDKDKMFANYWNYGYKPSEY